MYLTTKKWISPAKMTISIDDDFRHEKLHSTDLRGVDICSQWRMGFNSRPGGIRLTIVGF